MTAIITHTAGDSDLDVTDLVEIAQRADRRIRGIRRNDGRTAATTDALAAWLGDRDAAVAELLTRGEREIVGNLTVSFDLAERIRLAKIAGQTRPELSARLAVARRDIARRAQQRRVASLASDSARTR